MESVSNLTKETVAALQELVEVNIDSSKGFVEAADKIENPEIASLFRECGQEREKNANELRDIVRVNGEAAESDGSATGMLHRWWLNIRGTVTGGNEHTVLADAERGEDAIKHRYEDTLQQTAGSAVNDVLQKQYAGVKSRHDQIRDMRDVRA